MNPATTPNVAVAAAELRCHAALAAHSMPRRHASFTQQLILTTTTTTPYWYRDKSIYTDVWNVCNTKRIVKGYTKKAINYSTITIHRQVYDQVV